MGYVHVLQGGEKLVQEWEQAWQGTGAGVAGCGGWCRRGCGCRLVALVVRRGDVVVGVWAGHGDARAWAWACCCNMGRELLRELGASGEWVWAGADAGRWVCRHRCGCVGWAWGCGCVGVWAWAWADRCMGGLLVGMGAAAPISIHMKHL
ncbi:hypothetical protein FIBSPDRAFT_900384 [Athelia psychrophila]|uniref:Uncharacterized protein n=1 Tax=Athelia psychrophila TaxID=1759441 RepID=A0A165YJR0_9AGAM|nr:hypothetical protein FIBSPDRAFT_900384 [Fibularhizoctonia sp. CBS 109695]